ncbi:MAG: hypothetical protein GY700_16420 [Propionibacteriaceae bacterium]|nr:hypothetical protein [Propionibacteriaceae bacterium]
MEYGEGVVIPNAHQVTVIHLEDAEHVMGRPGNAFTMQRLNLAWIVDKDVHVSAVSDVSSKEDARFVGSDEDDLSDDEKPMRQPTDRTFRALPTAVKHIEGSMRVTMTRGETEETHQVQLLRTLHKRGLVQHVVLGPASWMIWTGEKCAMGDHVDSMLQKRDMPMAIDVIGTGQGRLVDHGNKATTAVTLGAADRRKVHRGPSTDFGDSVGRKTRQKETPTPGKHREPEPAPEPQPEPVPEPVPEPEPAAPEPEPEPVPEPVPEPAASNEEIPDEETGTWQEPAEAAGENGAESPGRGGGGRTRPVKKSTPAFRANKPGRWSTAKGDDDEQEETPLLFSSTPTPEEAAAQAAPPGLRVHMTEGHPMMAEVDPRYRQQVVADVNARKGVEQAIADRRQELFESHKLMTIDHPALLMVEEPIRAEVLAEIHLGRSFDQAKTNVQGRMAAQLDDQRERNHAGLEAGGSDEERVEPEAAQESGRVREDLDDEGVAYDGNNDASAGVAEEGSDDPAGAAKSDAGGGDAAAEDEDAGDDAQQANSSGRSSDAGSSSGTDSESDPTSGESEAEQEQAEVPEGEAASGGGDSDDDDVNRDDAAGREQRDAGADSRQNKAAESDDESEAGSDPESPTDESDDEQTSTSESETVTTSESEGDSDDDKSHRDEAGRRATGPGAEGASGGRMRRGISSPPARHERPRGPPSKAADEVAARRRGSRLQHPAKADDDGRPRVDKSIVRKTGAGVGPTYSRGDGARKRRNLGGSSEAAEASGEEAEPSGEEGGNEWGASEWAAGAAGGSRGAFSISRCKAASSGRAENCEAHGEHQHREDAVRHHETGSLEEAELAPGGDAGR